MGWFEGFEEVRREVAPHFALVIPDLHGYGRADKPAGDADHANHSKRRMATDVHALMQELGHARYFVAGHDRGGRVDAATLPCGHDRLEEQPSATARRLRTHFSAA